MEKSCSRVACNAAIRSDTRRQPADVIAFPSTGLSQEEASRPLVLRSKGG